MSRLVLTRRLGERLEIGPDIVVEVVKIEHRQVQIAITAPPEVQICREEAVDRTPRRAEGAAD
jgi:carbon storage regulator